MLMDLKKSYEIASPFNRFICFMIDLSLLVGLLEVFKLLFPIKGFFELFVFAIIIFLYFSILESKFKTTIGKRLGNLYVLTNGGEKLSYLKSATRTIGFHFSSGILNLGNLMALIDSKHRTLHDIMSETRVVYIGKETKSIVGKVIFLILFLFILLILLGFYLRVVVLGR